VTAESKRGDVPAPQDLYLDLLKHALTHTLYSGSDSVPFPSRGRLRRAVVEQLRRRGFVRIIDRPDHEQERAEGADWPLFAQTMVGLHRLDNLRRCIETLTADGIPGDLIETGVWRGGSSIFMRGVLKAHGITDRTVWVADSFRGLPPPDPGRYPADAEGNWHVADHLAVSVDEVRENFRRYGLLDDQVNFVKGWFRDTLPVLRDRAWALVRLDGDMYESTMDGLRNLYPGLSRGGFLVVDDYQIDVCREAVTDFRREQDITEPIERIDWTGVFWRKGLQPAGD
jgi:O-methyltransferase